MEYFFPSYLQEEDKNNLVGPLARLYRPLRGPHFGNHCSRLADVTSHNIFHCSYIKDAGQVGSVDTVKQWVAAAIVTAYIS
jgi:hypothetical protein